MIRVEETMPRTGPASARPAVNPMNGEFAVLVAGELCRFDTRLATIAAVEAACGDQPIVEILNGIVRGRRARDVIPLLAATLRCAEPPSAGDPDELAARATVGEAEAFVLALIFALGFTVGGTAVRGEEDPGRPLDGSSSGAAGGPLRSAA